MSPQNEQQVEQVRIFLEAQRKVITRSQWEKAYQSWQLGGNAWRKLRSGGTDIQTCLAWYQFIHKPGSREWRPSIIIDAVCRAAGLGVA